MQLTIFEAPIVEEPEPIAVPPQPPAIAPTQPIDPPAKVQRPIRAPFPAKAPGKLTHLGESSAVSLCGVENARHYRINCLTPWQFEGLRSRICPECIAAWEDGLCCPISPTACVRVWRLDGDRWIDLGSTTLVKAVERSLEMFSDRFTNLYCFPVDADGKPIRPGEVI